MQRYFSHARSLRIPRCLLACRAVRPRLLLLLLVSLTLVVWKAERAFSQQPQTESSTSQAEKERKREFLKSREQMKTAPRSPAANPTPAPKPKPKARPSDKEKQKTTTPKRTEAPKASEEEPAKAKPAPEESNRKPSRTTPKRKPAVTPKPSQAKSRKKAAAPKTTPEPKQEEEAPPAPPKPAPEKAPTPTATPVPVVTPAPVASTPAPSPKAPPSPVTPAPVTVEKSGYEESQSLAPAPRFTWFTRWKYLSKSIRAQIDRAPVQARRWRYIVVHNSGTKQGNAKAFDYYHLHVRHMVNGLAYHFVIGNGTSSGNGEVEIGNRWKKQINGGHVHSDYLNNIALGICLVGDFNHTQPTQQQLASLEELIRYLRGRVGKIDRKQAIVKAHKDINPPQWPTDCPGDRFPYAWLRKTFD